MNTPILVTGLPRSGTTWLARLLATASGTSMLGREPMNPLGRQYALAGTVDGWVRLADPSPQQIAVLDRVYRGLALGVYGRYGRRQWRAPMRGSRIIVKDPFAMLSMSTVARVTGATPILLYRHPAAYLVSFRRMGWSPNLDAARRLVSAFNARSVSFPLLSIEPPSGELSDAESTAWFWRLMYGLAMSDLKSTPGSLVVSHEELSKGRAWAARRLFASLELDWSPRSDLEYETPHRNGVRLDGLHDFDRDPVRVAEAWREELDADEIRRIEEIAEPVRDSLSNLRVRLAHD